MNHFHSFDIRITMSGTFRDESRAPYMAEDAIKRALEVGIDTFENCLPGHVDKERLKITITPHDQPVKMNLSP